MLTFMFTDIEGSTRKWQLYPDRMAAALALHDGIITEEINRFAGRVVKHTGDGFMAVFKDGHALECALSIQRTLLKRDWSAVDGLKVRIGIDRGESTGKNGDHFGPVVNRTARLMASGWGGQIIVGRDAARFEETPEGAVLVDRGTHMLKDLMKPQQIFTLSHPETDLPCPPLLTVSGHPHNLPVQTTPFVGRSRELADIEKLLLNPNIRLVTLLGYGGTGKTRTAIQTAADNLENFSHGAWFVPLEEADSRASIVSSIARCLSFGFSGGGEEDQLAGFLADRETLLVLDNFDHLAEHASCISKLLSQSPGLKILATSRTRLGIREETIYDLAGMTVPDVPELFLCTAQRVLPGFTPSADEEKSISSICRILAGLPLAIELAASWVRTISCGELEKELGKSLEILESTGGDLPERQRSMQSVFMYSWNLLDDRHKRCLAGLSVFEGGFTREAAAEISDCGLGNLKYLCDRSLVSLTGGDRYSLHPLTRQLVSRESNLVPDLHEKHAVYYHGLVGKLLTVLFTDQQKKILDTFELEFFNIRKGAVFACRSLRWELLDDYTRAASHLLQIRSRLTDGVDLFLELLSVVQQASANCCPQDAMVIDRTARLHERVSSFMLMSGRRDEGGYHLSEAAKLSSCMNDSDFEILCCAGLGNLAYLDDQFDEAEKLWSRAVSACRTGGSVKKTGSLLCNLAILKSKTGETANARKLIQEAGEIIAGLNDPYLAAALHSANGSICLAEGKTREAFHRYSESLALNRQTGNHRGASFCLEKMAEIKALNSHEEALPLAQESLEQALLSGSLSRTAVSRLMLAGVLAALERFDEALIQLDRTDDDVKRECNESISRRSNELREDIRKKRPDSGYPEMP